MKHIDYAMLTSRLSSPVLAPFLLRSSLRSGGPPAEIFFPALGLVPRSAAKSEVKTEPELDFMVILKQNYPPSPPPSEKNNKNNTITSQILLALMIITGIVR